MIELSYGNLILANNGKKGVLKQNENGSYRINAGGFNIENHAGIIYPANEYIQSQMQENSELRRKISQGYAYMEEEHPEPYNYVYRNGVCYKEEMTSILEWINRLRNFDHNKIVGIMSNIYFIMEDENNFNKPIYVDIDVKPLLEYPLGPRFKENLDTPESNTAVSIRTQIEPFKPGDRFKQVVYWTGFDWVKQPGMIHANKHMSAGCESILDGMEYQGEFKTYKVSDVIEALEQGIVECANDDIAFKKYGGFEARDYFSAELERIKSTYEIGSKVTIGANMGSFTDLFR